MSNPFLFDDDGDASTSEAANPFLLEGDSATEETNDDNPFMAQASNPFAFDDGDADEPKPNVQEQNTAPVQQPVSTGDAEDKAMSFFGTTITEDDDHDIVVVKSTTIDQNDGKVPPPRPTPPNQHTQDLISSVADHLDQTSSHLLDRIPKTRTPSPVSMRDLHSPSPTPDVANLLLNDDFEPDINSEIILRSDNPFADYDDEPTVNQIQTKPTRAVPPRPIAPPISQVIIEQAAVQQPAEADLFDFGLEETVSKPQAPKTNQDIMNLFAAPKVAEPPKPDLLMDEPIQTNITEVVAPSNNVRPPVPRPPRRPSPPAIVSVAQVAPIVAHKPVPEEKLSTIPNVRSIDDMPQFEKEATQFIEEPTETVPISTITINNEPFNSSAQDQNGFGDIDTISDNSSAIGSSYQQTSPGVATPFYTGGPDAQYLDRSQTPVSKEEIINSYINDTMSPAASNPFGSPEAITPVPSRPPPPTRPRQPKLQQNDNFDAFAAKFDSVKKEDNRLFDGFSVSGNGYKSPAAVDAWGASDFVSTTTDANDGFEADEGFDSFLAMQAPPEDETTKNFTGSALVPPSRGSQGSSIYAEEDGRSLPLSDDHKGSGSLESPSTPLFDDDVSQPLEDFPRITYTGDGWDMYLRQPNKKKITGQRFWKKCFLHMVLQGDIPVIQIFNQAKDKVAFHELPLQGCYSVSEISAQPFDQFGKIFTMKLQYIFYKERPGVRPGQITKAERITNKLSKFAAYAIQGDYQGVKEFGSDLKKLGLPVEHAPQVSQLFKIGSSSYEDMKHFSVLIEEQLFKFNVHRDRALTYKFEEVQVTGVDEYFAEVTADGMVTRQIARVRLFFLAFLSGMPTIELGVNDLRRQGKEVVGRHDIIPVATEEWIRLEGVEFHACVQQNEYEISRLIRFQPPDACYIELMRFRVRPPKNRELPLQVKAVWCVTGKKVELRVDVLVPGVTSRKLGQIPCEDVSIRFPIPECWIYLFRVEKHFRYGSVKSAHRRTGKIKGIERILGTVDQLQESLIEVTSGQAKYEHHHRSIVWRCPRLPKEGQGAYTTHQMVVRMALTSYDQIPEKLAEHCFVEYTMPQTTVSHTTVRSVSVQDSDSDDPPEKYVRYLARYEYRVGIEYTQGQEQNAYLAATYVKKEPPKEEKPKEEKPAPIPEAVSDSDSDSN